MSEKMTRRELQRPDKFTQKSTQWFDWAHEHPREVMIAGGALFAVILLVGFLFGGPGSPRAGAGAVELAAALELVDRQVVAPGTDAEDKATEAKATPAPKGAPFASEQEKQTAIAKALEDVRARFSGKPAAVAALLPLGDAQFKLGSFDDALASYDAYLKKTPADGLLRFLALEGRALSLEAKGDLPGALAAFDAMASDASGYADRALYGKARILERQEKWDEARAAYESLRKDHPESPMAPMGSDRLTALNAHHPAPAAAEGAPKAAPSAGAGG